MTNPFLQGIASGLQTYAQGGVIPAQSDTMPNMNGYYPLSNIQRTDAAYDAKLPYARSSELLGSGDTNVDPFTGEEKFADGGPVDDSARGFETPQPRINPPDPYHPLPTFQPQTGGIGSYVDNLNREFAAAPRYADRPGIDWTGSGTYAGGTGGGGGGDGGDGGGGIGIGPGTLVGGYQIYKNWDKIKAGLDKLTGADYNKDREDLAKQTTTDATANYMDTALADLASKIAGDNLTPDRPTAIKAEELNDGTPSSSGIGTRLAGDLASAASNILPTFNDVVKDSKASVVAEDNYSGSNPFVPDSVVAPTAAVSPLIDPLTNAFSTPTGSVSVDVPSSPEPVEPPAPVEPAYVAPPSGIAALAPAATSAIGSVLGGNLASRAGDVLATELGSKLGSSAVSNVLPAFTQTPGYVGEAVGLGLPTSFADVAENAASKGFNVLADSGTAGGAGSAASSLVPTLGNRFLDLGAGALGSALVGSLASNDAQRWGSTIGSLAGGFAPTASALGLSQLGWAAGPVGALLGLGLGGIMHAIGDNGEIRQMTPEEIAEWSKKRSEDEAKFYASHPEEAAKLKASQDIAAVQQTPNEANTPPEQLAQLWATAGGDPTEISNWLASRTGGMAAGGLASLPEYKAGGLLDGPGDGMSDSIPAVIKGEQPQRAALADGEFVIPADVVSHLGNGSTKAGSARLYEMMDKIRHARTGNSKQGKKINPHKFLPV